MSKEEEPDNDTDQAIGVGRYPCMPSLVALQQMRNRLHLAYLGKKLMKWTAMATGRELRRIAIKLNEAYGDFRNELANCYMMLARCRYFYPNLNKMVLEDPQEKASLVFVTSIKPVSGVKCLQFKVVEKDIKAYPYLGIDKGGETIRKTKMAWVDVLKKMIRIVQLQQNFSAVESSNKAATKKMMILQKLVIPKTLATIYYVIQELRELAREELFRVKNVVKYKNRRRDAMEQELNLKTSVKLPSSPPIMKPPPTLETQLIPEPVSVTSSLPISPLPPTPLITNVQSPKVTQCIQFCAFATSPIPRLPNLRDLLKTDPKIFNPLGKVHVSRPCKSVDDHIKTIIFDTPVSNEPIYRIKYLKKQLQEIIQLSKGVIDTSVNFNYTEFFSRCEDFRDILSQHLQPSEEQYNREKIKKNINNELTTSKKLKNEIVITPSLEDFLNKCSNVDDKIDIVIKDLQPSELVNKLDALRAYIEDIEKIANDVKNQGINTPGAEKLLRYCKQVKTSIDICKNKRRRKDLSKLHADEKLKLLKTKVANIENITQDMNRKGLHSQSIENFLAACKQFVKKTMDTVVTISSPLPALRELKEQLNASIEFSQKAKDEELINASVDDFIRSFKNIKQFPIERVKIFVNEKKEFGTIPISNEFKINISDVTEHINKLRYDRPIICSLSDLMKSCKTTRDRTVLHEMIPVKKEESCSCYLSECIDQSEKYKKIVIIDYIHKSKTLYHLFQETLGTLEYYFTPCSLCGVKEEVSMNTIRDSLTALKVAVSRQSFIFSTKSIKSIPTVSVDITSPESRSVFENKIKKIVKIKRVINKDGTIKKENQILNIKGDKYNQKETSLSIDNILFLNVNEKFFFSTKSTKSRTVKKKTLLVSVKENIEKKYKWINNSLDDILFFTEKEESSITSKAVDIKSVEKSTHNDRHLKNKDEKVFNVIRKTKSDFGDTGSSLLAPLLRHCVSSILYARESSDLSIDFENKIIFIFQDSIEIKLLNVHSVH